MIITSNLATYLLYKLKIKVTLCVNVIVCNYYALRHINKYVVKLLLLALFILLYTCVLQKSLLLSQVVLAQNTIHIFAYLSFKARCKNGVCMN